MQLILNDVESQAPVIVHPPPMTDDEFFDFSQLYPDSRIERTAEGEVIIMPGTGLETGSRNNELSRQLGNWAIEDGGGTALIPALNTCFHPGPHGVLTPSGSTVHGWPN